MSSKIAFFTSTRAEFGIFLPLLEGIDRDPDLEYLLFAGGSHLSQEYGYTIKEIEESGMAVSGTFDFLPDSDSSAALTHSAGIATCEMARLFENHSFDLVCILGDRFELLSVASAAILFRKPIVHLSGGESTLGAIDEQVRHMLTKASHIHLTYTDEYAQNIINMGEERWRVFNVGALGVDNFIRQPRMDRTQAFDELGLDHSIPLVLLTYHPESKNDPDTTKEQVKNIFKALDQFKFQVVVTAPNIERDREIIHDIIIRESGKDPHYHYHDSLGELLYNSLLAHCSFVIGNSSSGIVYAPYFKVPSINIGERQEGRIRHQSIIDVSGSVSEVEAAIHLALSAEFRSGTSKMKYKFGEGDSSLKIIEILKNIGQDDRLLLKKLVFENEA